METQHFVLSAPQVSEAFAAAGCIPLDGDFPDGLPAASGILPSALAGAGGELDPALRRILYAIAHPDVSLRVARGDAAESCVLRIRGDSHAALARSGASGWQFALIENRAAMLALIGDFIGEGCESFPRESFLKAIAAAAAPRDNVVSGICGRCGSLYSDSPAFCRECGESLRAPDQKASPSLSVNAKV